MPIFGKLWVALFVGIYLAAQPTIYINGFLKLIPVRGRNRAREGIHEIGEGTATGIGLILFGVPLGRFALCLDCNALRTRCSGRKSRRAEREIKTVKITSL